MTCAVLRRASAFLSFALLPGAVTACGGNDDGGGSATGTPSSTSSATDVDPGDSSTSSSSTTTTTTTSTTEAPDTGMTTVPFPVCGDGVPEPPEECDDGNDAPGDGCEADCTMSIDTSQWVDTQGGGGAIQDSGQGVAIDGAGNAYVIGYIVDTVGDANVWLRKYDPDGAEQFTVTFDPSAGADDRGYGIGIDSAGNIAVCGDTEVAPGDSDIWVAQLDTAGVEVWSTIVPGPELGADICSSITIDSTDAVIAGGALRMGNGDNDIWLGKYQADGTELWTATVAGPDGLDDRCEGVAVDDADNIIVAGFVSNEGFNRDVWLRKYDGDGTEAWTTIFDSVLMGSESGFGVAVAPDGTIGVAGTTPIVANNDEVWLATFEPEGGERVWQKNFGGPAVLNDAGLAVAADSEGAFIVAGFKGVTETDSDIWLRKWDAGGNVIWTQNVIGDGMDRDQALGVAVDADDNFVVTGEIRSEDSNDGDIWVAKFGP